MEFVLKTRANSSASQYVASSQRSSPQAISNGFPSVSSVYFVVIPVSLLPTGALPQLFPTVSLPSTLSSLPYRSFPPELSPSYFPSFSSMHPVVIPVSLLPHAPSPRSSPQAISHGSPSVHTIVASIYRSFPRELTRSYFPRFPFRPPCHHFRISLLPTGTSLPHRSFPTELSPSYISHGSPPSTLLSLPYRSFPTELSQSYFPRFPFPPPCRD